MKTIGEVLDEFLAADLLTADAVSLSNQPQAENHNPWFIQALLGLGGWLAAIFFIAASSFCIFVTLNLSSETTIGIAFSIIGIVLLLATTSHIHADFRPNLFMQQFRLVAHIAGHLALQAGILFLFRLWNYPSFWALTLLIQMTIFIWVYPDAIFRFLASLAIVAALNLLVFDLRIAGSLSLLIGLLALSLVINFGGFLSPEIQLKHFDILQVVPYGLVFGFFGSLLIETLYNQASWNTETNFHTPILSTILMLILLLWLILQIFRSYEISLNKPVTWLCLGFVLLIALLTLNTAGILAGILIILLAFRRRNWILMGLAYAFLAYFIVYFYYSLNLGLDIKAYILMGTGIALLLGRLIFKRILPTEKNKGVVA